ncbi:ferredoxin--NADP reductase [Shewanella marina]|uniref:ferredoxin--NADP reductase n=1 Tax=Shewanella marina TaxID=487319 RepID=UPI00047125C4|nr:ferredoxin--NADP reductase [Shewanella marina]
MWTQAKVVERIDWNDKLFSLKLDAEIAPFTAGQFIKLALALEDKRIARAYSLVNAPDARYLEILAIAVEDGQLSPQLQDLTVGDSVDISTKAAGFMVLDELPEQDYSQSQLWLLATGTAIGPFLSMLATKEPWQQFEKIIVVYGVRHAVDLAYLAQLEMLEQQYPEQFSLILSVTREDYNGGIRQRIPDAIATGVLEDIAGVNFSAAHSQVMICGNPDMVSGAVTVLNDKGLVKNLRRAPGQITLEKYW